MLEPRFKPGQIVWQKYKDQIFSTEIISLDWNEDEIEYTTDGMSELGHQLYGYHKDTKELKCLLFESKEKCQEYYKNIVND